MAYDQQKDQVFFISAGALTSAATLATFYYVPFHPIVVQEFCARITTSPTVTAAVVRIKKRPTPGSDTGQVLGLTLTLPVAAVIGTVYWKKGGDLLVRPGEQLCVEVTSVATAGAADFGVSFSPSWDSPGNSTLMVASA
jgi:hypothetical protein